MEVQADSPAQAAGLVVGRHRDDPRRGAVLLRDPHPGRPCAGRGGPLRAGRRDRPARGDPRRRHDRGRSRSPSGPPSQIAVGKGALGVSLESRTTGTNCRPTDRRGLHHGAVEWTARGAVAHRRRACASWSTRSSTGRPSRRRWPGRSGSPARSATSSGSRGSSSPFYLAGILSANLALVNILPFPPLDGGRIAVLLRQGVSGERVSVRAERLTYLVGFVFLMSLPGLDHLLRHHRARAAGQ